MFGISSRARRGRLFAVADVASASAAFGIVELSADQPAKLLFSERVPLPIEKRTDAAAVFAIGRQLRASAEKLLALHMKSLPTRRIERVYCVIGSPWTDSQTIISRTQFQRDEPISGKLLTELAQKALAQAADSKHAGILEAGIVRTELNGYPTRQPEGKHAHDVAVVTLVSSCDQKMRGDTQAALEAVLPHVPQFMHSSTRAMLSVVREIVADTDYVIMEVSGDATTFIVVRAGVPSEQSVIAEGVISILRRLSITGLTEEVLGLLRMISKDQCENEACTKLLGDLARIEPELVRVFGEAMARHGAGSRLPNRLVLITNPDVAPWLSKFLSRIDFTQFTQTSQPFSVTPLLPKDVERWATAGPGALLDEGLALATALVNAEAGNKR